MVRQSVRRLIYIGSGKTEMGVLLRFLTTFSRSQESLYPTPVRSTYILGLYLSKTSYFYGLHYFVVLIY